MASIVWDKLEDRTYESGIDRCVLFPKNDKGVPWSGVASIDETTTPTSEQFYYDGVKYLDFTTPSDFSGVLKAFTFPDEFLKCQGYIEEQSGMYLTDQTYEIFDLTYRVMVGSDHYKLHILWNVTAIPEQITHKTFSSDVEPVLFSWRLFSTPEIISNYRPTSHIILDSKNIDPLLLSDIEGILYGSDSEDSRLPPMRGFINYVRKWDRLIIFDNGDGTWTAVSKNDEDIIMIDDTTFEITSTSATYLDSDTYEISSSEKNQEDIY